MQSCIYWLHCNPSLLYSLPIAKANDLKSPVEKWNYLGFSWTWFNIFNSDFHVLSLLSWNHFFWLISVFSAGSSCIHTYTVFYLLDVQIHEFNSSCVLLLCFLLVPAEFVLCWNYPWYIKVILSPYIFLTVQLHSYQRVKNDVTWCKSYLGWKFYTNRVTGNIIH